MEDPTPLEKLKAEVTEITTVVDSAVVLINTLAGKLRDAVAESATFAELQAAVVGQADALDAAAQPLAAAIAANTPAAPAPEPTPEPAPTEPGDEG